MEKYWRNKTDFGAKGKKLSMHYLINSEDMSKYSVK